MMHVQVFNSVDEVNRAAAQLVIAQLTLKPDSVLCLPTGTTPEALYELLCQAHEAGRVSFKRATIVNLDEYIGLEPDHPQSYRYFMDKRLFSRVDIDPENIHMPDGMAKDPQAEAVRYEALIDGIGGFDLEILGVGRNGHVAFNEPGAPFDSLTGVMDLTVRFHDIAPAFEDKSQVPREGISMGIGSIKKARRILMMALGGAKAQAVKDMVEGPITTDCPASVLQTLPDVIVMCDSAAAALLSDKYRGAGDRE